MASLLFSMRLIVDLRACLGLLLAMAGAACGAGNDSADVAIQYHCAGSAWFASNANLVTLHKVLALPSAAPIENLVLTRFAASLDKGLNLKSNISAGPLLEPLLSNVFQAESVAAFGNITTNAFDFILAFKLEASGAQTWHDTFDKAFGRPGEKFAVKGAEGWRWNREGSDTIWIVPAGEWLVTGRGREFASLQGEYLDQISRQGRPVPPLKDNWLETSFNLARLTAVLPESLQLLKPAEVRMSVAGERDNLRITAQLNYPDAVNWAGGPMRMPKGLIKGPLVSFTAGHDVAAFLNMSPAFSHLPGNPLTNDFFAWASKQMTFLSYMAWPVADTTNTLESLSTEAVKDFSPALKDFNGTELRWLPNQKSLLLANLRVILPVLRPAPGEDDDFLILALFPPPPGNEPAPAELAKQINGRTNLVYYDWELTGPRAQQWEMLGHMLLTRARKSTPYVMRANRVLAKLRSDLAPLAGNTVTEVTREAPDELSAERSGPLGFTGIEMFLLSEWLSTLGAPADNSRPAAH